MADAVSLRDYREGEVLRLDLTRQVPRDYHFVHRADLIDMLADGARAAGVQIRLLQKVESLTPGTPAQIATASGATLDADLVIGADGLHSKVRPVLNDAAKPFFTGQVAWRAVVPFDGKLERVARLFMGPRASGELSVARGALPEPGGGAGTRRVGGRRLAPQG